MKINNLIISIFSSLCLLNSSLAQTTPDANLSIDVKNIAEMQFNSMKAQGGRLESKDGLEISFQDILRGISGKVTYIPEKNSPLAMADTKLDFSAIQSGKQILVKEVQKNQIVGRRLISFDGDPAKVELRDA